jgi:hypothetical protein
MSFSAPSSYAPQDSGRQALTERLRSNPAAGNPAVGTPERNRTSLFLPFVLALLIVLGTTAYGVFQPQHQVHPPAPGQRGSLVWGDGMFANRLELSAWLHQHHTTFARFARNHPAALKLVP